MKATATIQRQIRQLRMLRKMGELGQDQWRRAYMTECVLDWVLSGSRCDWSPMSLIMEKWDDGLEESDQRK